MISSFSLMRKASLHLTEDMKTWQKYMKSAVNSISAPFPAEFFPHLPFTIQMILFHGATVGPDDLGSLFQPWWFYVIPWEERSGSIFTVPERALGILWCSSKSPSAAFRQVSETVPTEFSQMNTVTSAAPLQYSSGNQSSFSAVQFHQHGCDCLVSIWTVMRFTNIRWWKC